MDDGGSPLSTAGQDIGASGSCKFVANDPSKYNADIVEFCEQDDIIG